MADDDRESGKAFVETKDPLTQFLGFLFLATLMGPWTVMAIGWSQRP